MGNNVNKDEQIIVFLALTFFLTPTPSLAL